MSDFLGYRAAASELKRLYPKRCYTTANSYIQTTDCNILIIFPAYYNTNIDIEILMVGW